jgi:hypothetical protein
VLPEWVDVQSPEPWLELPCYAQVPVGKPATTKYYPDPAYPPPAGLSYGPPKFSRDGVAKAFMKYYHDIPWISPGDFWRVVSWERKVLAPHITGVGHWSWEEVDLAVDRKKSCGIPFKYRYGPTKGDVLRSNTVEDLFEYFRRFTCLQMHVDKDEMRLKGKLARCMRPVCTAMVVAGNRLYGKIMETFNESALDHPSTVGASVPGADFIRLWGILYRHKGDLFSVDSQGHDANMALWTAIAHRESLRPFIDPEHDDDHDRYFSMAYCGYCVILGQIYLVPGQSTGQTLTSFGNTFSHIGIMSLHAIRKGWTYAQFCQLVIYFVKWG